MGTGVKGKWWNSFAWFGLLLLLYTPCLVAHGHSVEQQAQKVQDTVWVEQVVVSNLSTMTISNGGITAIVASFGGRGSCPMGTLSLVFSNASSAGTDVSIPGEMNVSCQTATFHTSASADFQSILAGTYNVQMQLDPSTRLVAFEVMPTADILANASYNISGMVRSNTTSIAVVRAAVADFLGQSSAISRTHATVTLTVGLDRPVELPTSVGLSVWDPSAVEVDPANLTWQPGESGSKTFILRLTRAAPSGQAAAWAELVAIHNVLFNTTSPPRLSLQAPRPKFYVVSNQVLYRGSNDPASSNSSGSRDTSSSSSSSTGNGSGSGSGSSSGLGGNAVVLSLNSGNSQPRIGWVGVEVRRTSSSPFGSTLQFRANVLQVTAGCTSHICAGAVSGSGRLNFYADNSSALATLSVNWTALPEEAALAIGVQLTPIDNAELVDVPVNTVALYVYGSTYGLCPAGTLGPWQDPWQAPPTQVALASQRAPSFAEPPRPYRGNTSQSGSSASPSGLAPPAPPRDPCNAITMLQALLDYDPTAAMLPVLSACAGEEVVPILPTRTAASQIASESSTSPSPSLPSPTSPRGSGKVSTLATAGTKAQPPPLPAPPSDGGGSVAGTPVELLVPYHQDAVSVFLPLGSANETVLVLNTNCDPEPKLTQPAIPSPSSTSGVAAWAELTLPTSLQLCYVLLQVYASVWSEPATPMPGPTQKPLRNNSGGNVTAAATSSPPHGPLNTHPSLPSSNATAARMPGTSTVDNVTSSSNHPPPTELIRGLPRAVGTSTPPAPAEDKPVRVNVRILSMVQLRMFNVTLRPRSNPDIFSAGALSLYLVHRPSGRCLPLCGLAQPMLDAAAAQVFGDAFDTASQSQLDKAGWILTQAIRGNSDAVAQLEGASGANGGSNDGSVVLGNRRMLGVGESFRRWLAVTWLQLTGEDMNTEETATGSRRTVARLGRGAIRDPASVSSRRRRVLQLNSPSSPVAPQGLPTQVDAPGPALLSSPSATILEVNSSSVESPGPMLVPNSPPPHWTMPPQSSMPSPAVQDASPLSPPPVPPSWPSPEAPSSPPPSYPGIPLTARPMQDGFNLPGALRGNKVPMRVLYNPAFLEFCHASDAQVVDLELLKAPYNLSLEASSSGVELRLGTASSGGGGAVAPAEVVLGPTTRSELLQLRKDEASGGWPDASAGDSNRSSSSSSGSRGGGGSGRTSSPGANTGDCSSGQPQSDMRVSVSLVAPDSVSTALIELHLYMDYEAAVTAAAAAALKCQEGSSHSRGGGTNANGIATSLSAAIGISATESRNSFGGTAPGNSGNGHASTSAPTAAGSVLSAAAPASSAYTRSVAPWIVTNSQPMYMSLSAPASLWTACQPCGPGTFSDTANATTCQPCGPGTASNGSYNKQCAACEPGSFTVQIGSTSCRPCYAGSYAPRAGSTVCLKCPESTTSLADGAKECVVPPQPGKGNSAIAVYFQAVLNVSPTANSSVAQAASASGMSNVSADSIFKMAIAADTAAALRIPPSMVHVIMWEVSPSTFLVNVSATMPLGQAPSTNTGTSPGTSPAGSTGASPEVDADTLINRLVGNPDDSFPRTKEVTGGSLQVQHVKRQVVVLDDSARGVNAHVVLWPTLAGTALLAMVVGFACRRYCRRRRARMGLSLPPISDALDRWCSWKYPTSPPPMAQFPYGKFMNMELQDQCPTFSAARHRLGRVASKSNLPSTGMTLASDSSDVLSTSSTPMDLDALAMMYTRDVLASPRI